eukprot:scaffold4011_cov197-Ochromonas_danica.AAC.33
MKYSLVKGSRFWQVGLISTSPFLSHSNFSSFLASELNSKLEASLLSSPSLPALVEHPGFLLVTQCNSWRAAGFAGEMRAWSAPLTHWICRCHTVQENQEEESLYWRIFASPLSDLPHLKLYIKHCHTDGIFKIDLDYTPRVDLIGCLDYYDKFYQELDVERNAWEHLPETMMGGGAEKLPIHRLVSSPAEFRRSLPDDVNASHSSHHTEQNGSKNLEQLATNHVSAAPFLLPNKWLRWLASGKTSIPIDSSRDSRLQEVVFEDLKLTFADMLGPLFAPKAEDIAAALMGPRLG